MAVLKCKAAGLGPLDKDADIRVDAVPCSWGQRIVHMSKLNESEWFLIILV